MKKSNPQFVFAFVLISAVFMISSSAEALAREDSNLLSPLAAKLESLQVPFIANNGQTHPDVGYYAHTFGGTLFITRDGQMVYSLCAVTDDAPRGLVLRESLVGAYQNLIQGEDACSTGVNYFKGSDPRNWCTDVPTYAKVSMGEVYKGVTVTLQARGHNVEKIFRVQPGAEPQSIAMRVEGARFMHVSHNGQLVLKTSAGDLSFTKPVAYQVINGRRQPVDVAYRISGNTYGFQIGVFDRRRELVIDPLMSTYMGGGRREGGQAIGTNIVVDGNRWIYVAGYTTSNDFPGYDMFQSSPGYNQDAFIAMIKMDLTAAQYTYLGGSGEDSIWDLAIRQPDGQVFVVGWTDGDFPVTNSNSRGGERDAFVARLSWDLGTLEKSRYLGGTGRDSATGLALYNPGGGPSEDVVYVTGSTRSNDFPKTSTGAQPAKAGGTTLYDAFAARLDIDLALQRATYLGGHSDDHGGDIAVHPVEPHDVYVVGQTAYDNQVQPYGSAGCFPWTEGGALPFAGGHDTFVVRLNADLTASPAPQATYYGGQGLDFGYGVAAHPSTSHVYITGGRTNDTNTKQGAFVAYFNRELTELQGDTILYGNYIERATDIAIVPYVGIYIAGFTSGNLEGTSEAILPTFRGGQRDMFVARFHNNLDLDVATYIGSAGQEESFGHGLAVAEDPSTPEEDWHVFVAGEIYSNGLIGVTDTTAFQTRINGTSDVVVTRLNADLRPDANPDIEVQPRWLDFGNVRLNTNSVPKSVTLENIGGSVLSIASLDIVGVGAADYTIDNSAGTGPCSTDRPLLIDPGASCTLTLTFRPTVNNQWRSADIVLQVADDPDEPLIRIPLYGYSGPDIDAPSPIEFPDTEVGYTETRLLMIQNRGYSDLEITGIQKAGIDGSGENFSLHFSGTNNYCPDPNVENFTLAPNQYCYVQVDFAPTMDTAPAKEEAVAIIYSNDLDENPAFVTLLGTGVTDLDADIWSHDLEFGDVAVGNSKSLPWLITNTGSEPLTVDGLALSAPALFLMDQDGGAIPCGTPPFTLQAVSSCTMMVTFRPQTDGPINETLTIFSNDTNEDAFVVNLSGVGGLDTDGDGVPDNQESGDANGDGTADSEQQHVASVPSFDSQHVVVIESDDPGVAFIEVRPEAPPEESLPWPLDRYEFPFGLFHFKVDLPDGTDTANITITLPAGETVDTYIKYGPELPDYLDPHYYDFGNSADYPGAVEITGNIITLHLVDGGAGDHDFISGQITDPGAPARWIRGDFNTSGTVDLKDAVLCLKILSGSVPPTPINLEADADRNGEIGLPDLVFILQRISLLR